MPVSTTWPHCWHWQSTVLRGPSLSPGKNIALCLGLLNWYLFLIKLGENITKDIFGSSQSSSSSLSSSMFSNFCSGVTLDRSHLVGDNQHDFFFSHSGYSEDVYLSAKDSLGYTHRNQGASENEILGCLSTCFWQKPVSRCMFSLCHSGGFSERQSIGYAPGLFPYGTTEFTGTKLGNAQMLYLLYLKIFEKEKHLLPYVSWRLHNQLTV